MVKHGILLAGGTGSRLQPFTSYVSKQLLNVGGKPIIDYPINTLKQAGIENLTIVVGSTFSGQILDYVQDGARYGLNVNYRYQHAPRGIAEAISLCEKEVANEQQFIVCLGDNFFNQSIHWNNTLDTTYAQIVLFQTSELQRFGVATIVGDKKIAKIEEKPQVLRPQFKQRAIAGCYVFDNKFFEYFPKLKLSQRGEFEITEILQKYLEDDRLYYTEYQGMWHDLGIPDSIEYVNQYLYSQKNDL